MILWGKDHQARAEALAAAYGEQAMAEASLARSNKGIQPVVCVDATLTVWGHGGATKFSDMLDVEFGVLIQNWKKQNPSLKTVELVTCDAQHNIIPLAGYAMRVAKYVDRDYKDIVIKALPVGQHSDDRSVLWANAVTSTFCYLTAPSQVTFDSANQRVQVLDPICGGNLNEVAAEMAKERTSFPPNNFTVSGGNLGSLRASLAVIKTA
ncbi:hypothetical protein [Thalassotalea sp. PLHSN55]|uniref:hypothetical protein n=1 Tax=Thalassotalea sp. PLHSN55 TaxID=3435888 RepID=UPI003F86F84A